VEGFAGVGRGAAAEGCRSYTYDCGGNFEKSGWLPKSLHIIDVEACSSDAEHQPFEPPRVRGLVGSLEPSLLKGARNAISTVFRDVWNGLPSKSTGGKAAGGRAPRSTGVVLSNAIPFQHQARRSGGQHHVAQQAKRSGSPQSRGRAVPEPTQIVPLPNEQRAGRQPPAPGGHPATHPPGWKRVGMQLGTSEPSPSAQRTSRGNKQHPGPRRTSAGKLAPSQVPPVSEWPARQAHG